MKAPLGMALQTGKVGVVEAEQHYTKILSGSPKGNFAKFCTRKYILLYGILTLQATR